MFSGLSFMFSMFVSLANVKIWLIGWLVRELLQKQIVTAYRSVFLSSASITVAECTGICFTATSRISAFFLFATPRPDIFFTLMHAHFEIPHLHLKMKKKKSTKPMVCASLSSSNLLTLTASWSLAARRADDMTGAHNIGFAWCTTFRGRIYRDDAFLDPLRFPLPRERNGDAESVLMRAMRVGRCLWACLFFFLSFMFFCCSLWEQF